jgi:hypothetical protein
VGFCQELLAPRLQICLRNGIPPGNTSSWMLVQAVKIKVRKNPPNVRILGSATPNPICQHLKKEKKYINIFKIEK